MTMCDSSCRTHLELTCKSATDSCVSDFHPLELRFARHDGSMWHTASVEGRGGSWHLRRGQVAERWASLDDPRADRRAQPHEPDSLSSWNFSAQDGIHAVQQQDGRDVQTAEMQLGTQSDASQLPAGSSGPPSAVGE